MRERAYSTYLYITRQLLWEILYEGKKADLERKKTKQISGKKNISLKLFYSTLMSKILQYDDQIFTSYCDQK